MDTTPIYELRERLRAAAMAGTNLLSEDFRLRRAYEAFAPLEKASPVFAKIGQLTGQLLSPECQNTQGALLDTITLTDAVICTLGTVDVTGEVECAGGLNTEANTGSLVVNAPYSTLKELLEALTTSGSGHYGYVCDAHKHNPELFRDYRVKHSLVQALGASYSGLADNVEQWLIEDGDRTILPALYKDFDPKGKKEMVRRVRVIGELAGAEANDFYVRMLADAEKEVRTELISALRYEQDNVPLLFNLTKTEKGKNKDNVFEMLAMTPNEEANDFFKDLAEKKTETVLKYLRNSTTEWAAELVADIFDKTIEKLDSADSASDKEKQDLSGRLQAVVRAVFGKGGEHICACYRYLLAQKNKINLLLKKTWKKPKDMYTYDMIQYGVLTPCQYWYRAEGLDIETTLGKILHHSLIVNSDPDLQALALELYQNENSGKTNIKFLPAAATVKLLGTEDCVDWFNKQIMENTQSASKLSPERFKAVFEAVNYVSWDSNKNRYRFYGSYVDVYDTDYKSIERAIELPHAEALIHWFLKQDISREIDYILAQLVPLNDEVLSREIGEYIYNRILVTSGSYRHQLLYDLEKCRWTDYKGMGVNAVKNDPSISTWDLYCWLAILPESKEAVMEEMRTICSMVRSGELKTKKLKLEELENYMDRWYSS